MAATDAELDQTYEIIEQDAVPAPAPPPNSSMDQRVAALLKWLQPTDFLSPGNDFMKHLHSYVPGTGRWVRELPVFRAWTGTGDAHGGDDERCLHVRGVAGSGKSVFAASTIRQLQESGAVVLFFFFRQIVDKNHSAKYLVRDFAAQLLPHSPSLVATLTADSQDNAVNGNELRLVWPALAKALTGGIGQKKVFCVVDALDEMDDGDLLDMVNNLVVLSATKSAAARVMLTSRPLPKIEQAVGHQGIVRLKLDPTLLYPDVARFVDARIAILEPRLSDDKNELVRNAICERAKGLFLHARLVADNLANGLRDGHITEETLPSSLDCLPRTLWDVYEEMLKEHARRSRVTAEQQAKILMCVTHASRPLRLIELGSLIATMLHLDLRQGKDLVRASCGRLLELLEDETVSVIHHSFTEFLHDKSRTSTQGAFPVLDEVASHAMLAVLSLEYLDGCSHILGTTDKIQKLRNGVGYSYDGLQQIRQRMTKLRIMYPFMSYAADNNTFHLSRAAAGPVGRVKEALTHYVLPGKPAWEAWRLTHPQWMEEINTMLTVFHMAAVPRGGIAMPLFVAECFEEADPTHLDSRDSYGRTPLSYAAHYGNVHLAKFLLGKGADPESGDHEEGRMPLHWATERGQLEIVRLLLEAGVDPLIKTCPVLKRASSFDGSLVSCTPEEAEKERTTALSSVRHVKVLEVFMPFVTAAELNLLFHWAHGDIHMVKMILDTGRVDVDCSWRGTTKLFQAARNLDLDLIKLLLEHGADPNKRCGGDDSQYSCRDDVTMSTADTATERGPTPLHALAGFGEGYMSSWANTGSIPECIQVLIEAGACVNATADGPDSDGANLTPLHYAVQENRRQDGWGRPSSIKCKGGIVKALLSAGADPNAKTAEGNTPAHIASSKNNTMLDTLMKHGADLEARNECGRTPLMELVRRNCCHYPTANVAHVTVFNKLLDLGADVNATDNNGNNILHHAMHSLGAKKYALFFEKLIHACVDVNRRNHKGHSPLWYYKQVDDGVLSLLIEAGMDLNARDDNGRTMLWHVLKQHGRLPESMNKLIHLGADPRVLANDGSTLLHAAARAIKSQDFFRFLISVGVRADLVDENGDTPIHTVLASFGGEDTLQPIVQLLVEAGISPLAKNAKGQTGLHMVNDLATLKFVLGSRFFDTLNIKEPDIDGFTPLHKAAGFGRHRSWMIKREEAVATLLRAGADPTALTRGGISPLHIAARLGDASVLDLLLRQYSDRGVLGQQIDLLGDGRAPLHYACRSGRPDAVWVLLRRGADPFVKDEKGLMAIHALAEFEMPSGTDSGETKARTRDIVKTLLLSGVELTAEATVQDAGETKNAVTALDLAVERKCWHMVRALMEHGVEAANGYKHSKEFILATDKDKATEEVRIRSMAALKIQDNSKRGRNQTCRWRGRWAASQLMNGPLEEDTQYIANGQAILGFQDTHQGADVVDILHGALLDGDYDSVREYALLGGDVLRLNRYKNHTFLHLLVRGGYSSLLEEFANEVSALEAQETVQTTCGTLLGEACAREHPSLYIIQLLVEKIKVDVNAVYNRSGHTKLQGATALHILASGAYFWQVEALEYLLSKGADIEARNEYGMTPLLAAVDHSYPDGFWRRETLQVLLNHGANVNVRIQREAGGQSALDLSGQPDIIKLLLQNGARVKDRPGILSLVIREWVDPDTVKALLEAGADPNELSPDQRYALDEAARPTTKASWQVPSDLKSRKQAIVDMLLSYGADLCAPYPDGSFVLQSIIEDRGLLHNLLSRTSQIDVNLRGRHRRTLLTSACIPTVSVGKNHNWAAEKARLPTILPNVVFTLLETQADVLAVDDEGRTALHWFCTLPGQYNGSYQKAFEALVDRGSAAMHMADKQGRKPLHLALLAYADRSQRSLFAINHLISAGANTKEPDPITGNSILHQLAPRLFGNPDTVGEATQLFRHLAASHDVNARNNMGETPILTFIGAAWMDDRDIKSRVLDPKSVLAHHISRAAALDIFVDLDVDLAATDTQGRTVMHLTVARELPRLNGLDRYEEKDIQGAFKKLIELGVNPYKEDHELRTAIDIAVARDLRCVVQLFSNDAKAVDK